MKSRRQKENSRSRGSEAVDGTADSNHSTAVDFGSAEATSPRNKTKRRLNVGDQIYDVRWSLSQHTLDKGSFEQTVYTNRFVDPQVEDDFLVFVGVYRPLLIGGTMFALFLVSVIRSLATGTLLSGEPLFLILSNSMSGLLLLGTLAYLVAPYILKNKPKLVVARTLEVIVGSLVAMISIVMAMTQASANDNCYQNKNLDSRVFYTKHDLCVRHVFSWTLIGHMICMVVGMPRAFWIVPISVLSIIAGTVAPWTAPNKYEAYSEMGVRMTLLVFLVTTFTVVIRVLDGQQRKNFSRLVLVTRQFQEYESRQGALRALTSSILPKAIQKKLNMKQVTIDQADASCIVVELPVMPKTAYSARMAASFSGTSAQIADMFETCGVDRLSVGDRITGTSNLITPCEDHPDRMCYLATQLLDQPFSSEIKLRAGVSSGAISGFVVATSYIRYDVFGEPVIAASTISNATMTGTCGVDSGVVDRCESTVFKTVNGFAYTIVANSKYDPVNLPSHEADPSGALEFSDSFGEESGSDSRSDSVGSFMSSSDTAISPPKRNKWLRVFKQEGRLLKNASSKIEYLAIENTCLEERFAEEVVEDKFWRVRASEDTAVLQVSIIGLWLLLCVAMPMTSTQYSLKNITHGDPDAGMYLCSIAAAGCIFVAAHCQFMSTIPKYVVILTILIVILAEVGTSLQRPSTSSNSPLYLLFLCQLILSCIAVRQVLYLLLTASHVFFFFGMMYVRGHGIAKAIDYAGLAACAVIFITFERHRRWRERATFKSVQVVRAVAELESRQTRLRENIIRSVIPAAYVSDAVENLNSRLISSNSFAEVLVIEIRFDNLAAAVKDISYYDVALQTISNCTGIVEAALENASPGLLEILTAQGDTMAIAGPLMRSSSTIIREDALNQAVEDVLGLFVEIDQGVAPGTPFTFIAECEHGIGVLSHLRRPSFFLAGTAMNNARTILREAPAGTHAVSERFSFKVPAHRASMLQGVPFKWKLRGMGSVSLVNIASDVSKSNSRASPDVTQSPTQHNTPNDEFVFIAPLSSRPMSP